MAARYSPTSSGMPGGKHGNSGKLSARQHPGSPARPAQRRRMPRRAAATVAEGPFGCLCALQLCEKMEGRQEEREAHTWHRIAGARDALLCEVAHPVDALQQRRVKQGAAAACAPAWAPQRWHGMLQQAHQCTLLRLAGRAAAGALQRPPSSTAPSHPPTPSSDHPPPTCQSSSVWCMRPSCSVAQGKALAWVRRWA